MFNTIDFTKLGGLHTYQDTLDYMQTCYGLDADAVAKFIGEHYVIHGCVDDGVNVSDGWIVVNGQKIPLVGGVKSLWIVMEDITGQESFDNGTLQTIYFTRRAKFGIASGGADDFLYADLKRLPYGANSIGQYATMINKMLQAVLQKEPEVILDGCLVTNVTTGPDTLDISAGLVLFAGKPMDTPAYSGAYPAYLKPDASWVTVAPGAGLFITFDPHTSQRYVNVLDRALTPVGKINMYKTLSDRFSLVTGLGKWDMKGYKLMYTMQNRVPVGLWFDGIAEANVSDAVHDTAGNQVGEKKHELVSAEQGSLKIKGKSDDYGGGTDVGTQVLNFNGTLLVNDGPPNAGGYGTEITVKPNNDADDHENRQPSTIVVYAERI